MASSRRRGCRELREQRCGQRPPIYCGGWRRVKCNNLKQHFCNLTTRVINLNEMRALPWNLSNRDRLSLSGKVTERLILWRAKEQGQPPWCVTECLLRKLLGEKALFMGSSQEDDGERSQGRSAPPSLLPCSFGWAGRTHPAVFRAHRPG